MARVIGTVVTTIKHESFKGFKLLMVQPVNYEGRYVEQSFVAIDAAQAGIGNYVLVVEEGKSARQVLERDTLPCEAVIVGVIDYLTFGGRQRYLSPPESGRQRRA